MSENIFIRQDPEYIKGYEDAIRFEKAQEEKSKSPYRQGFYAASQELRRQRILAIETEEDQDDTITRLETKMQELDDRLAKLEKYTQE